MRLPLFFFAAICLASCAAPRLNLIEHPLVDRIWDVSGQRFIDPGEAEARIAGVDIALLGEIHDNPAHHQIQRHLLQQVVARGKRPALAMEQMDTEGQAAINATRRHAATATDIAKAGNIGPGWEWPAYRPLVVLALKERLPIVAANLSRARTRSIVTGGLAALGAGEAIRLGLDQPWTAKQNATLRQMLVDGHCGDDNPVIDKLINVQRSRDAVMADKILESDTGVVAIIGRSHARSDIGVPLYLKEREPDKSFLSLGLVEVDPDKFNPGEYPDAAQGLHDLVWFTPRALRPDPCHGYKKVGH